MRLIFSTTNHMNTDISDERGYIHYTISTPSAFKKVTTITKYRWSGPSGVPETMGVIEWHRLKETVFRFDGNMIPADAMLEKRAWNTYVDFFLRVVMTGCDVDGYWRLGSCQRSVFRRS